MMPESASRPLPPDHQERLRALDAERSVLVQAPAGSGKTDLLTRRFLLLLGRVEDPGQIVAITFTRAAAAEMRHRILAELEKAAHTGAPTADADSMSMAVLAYRAYQRSALLGWDLINLPGQLRISTIDSFCRELALQQPLLSGLGGGLDTTSQPAELYRLAARRTMARISGEDAALRAAIESILLWRDNGWQEMEDLLVAMLGQRDRWMQGFLLRREQDWDALRARLERPFAEAATATLTDLSHLLDQLPLARNEALELARFACTQNTTLHRDLAELPEFPRAPFPLQEQVEMAHQASVGLAVLVLTKDGRYRKSIDKNHGFPTDRKAEKHRLLKLIASLDSISGLEATLSKVLALPPLHYAEDDWTILRACFTLLSRAAAELKVVFADAGCADFIEVAQIAESLIHSEDGLPSDAAIAISDQIHHLLVDEFQDTSRRQHQLLAHLIAAWPEREGRTCFVVGDPMQSIYFFRDADAELFPRVREVGLEIPNSSPLLHDPVQLTANFRTVPSLVERLNECFERVFAVNDGSDVSFSAAQPARQLSELEPTVRMNWHFKFIPQATAQNQSGGKSRKQSEEIKELRVQAAIDQAAEIVRLIRGHEAVMEQFRAKGVRYRIAVLGRTRNALRPIAAALREATIPFRAVDLEPLQARPEILDALALVRALLNPHDRVAWLGVLRAPWSALSLEDLYIAAGGDDRELLHRPIRAVLTEQLSRLSEQGRVTASRVLQAMDAAPNLRFSHPAISLGTWIEQVWLSLGGEQCVDATSKANLDLLWRVLDQLPEGEPDLLGPALDAALSDLQAQPDPQASTEHGVQLMTIHKSKGLEFEVVIVPNLQAGTGRRSRNLLSWLERGRSVQQNFSSDSEDAEVTEFLVAPLQSKGTKRSPTRFWVDQVRNQRESQELRRLLYVAATRARDELHLFAHLAYKTAEDGLFRLVEPTNSLLATAWPAAQPEAEQQFATWQGAFLSESEAGISLAASAESNLIVMPSASSKRAFLYRLPDDYESPTVSAETDAESIVVGADRDRLYTRHEGGPLSRALGRSVHLLLEELSRAFVSGRSVDQALAEIHPRIVADLRSMGVSREQAEQMASQSLAIVRKTLEDPFAGWILAKHPEAASEVRWTGVVNGALRTVQVDRVFRAGLEPHSAGSEAWWIVDYKTTVGDSPDSAPGVVGLRSLFAPQVEAYARILHNLHGDSTPIRGALYYPRLAAFDWWEI